MVDFSEYRNKAGIYKWENKINHKCYIGQAKDLNRRLIHHFSNVKTCRYNSPLYKAVAKYGINNFDITIVEVLEASDDLNKRLDEREIYYIEYYKSYKEGYNQTKGGERHFNTLSGRKEITVEWRNKIKNSLYRYAVEVYENGKLFAYYDNTEHANEFFGYSDSSTVLKTIKRSIRLNSIYKKKYTFKLIEKHNGIED